MQVNPVNLVIRMAMAGLVVLAQTNFVQQLACVKPTELKRQRLDAITLQGIAQAQVVEHLHGIRTHLNCGAYFVNISGLFIQANTVPIFQQACRGCEPTNPCANHCNIHGRHAI
jgi:hypothetical protein